MINLLPPEEKEKLFLEEKKRLAVVLTITMAIPLLCLILVLLSIRFYLLADVNSQNIILEQAKKKYQTPDFLNFKDIIQNDNATLLQLESFYKKEIHLNDALKTISSVARPNGLYLTDLSLDRKEDQKIKVTASGFSGLREDLVLFQKNIEKSKEIKNLSFSPESWVSPKNVRFYVTFEIFK